MERLGKNQKDYGKREEIGDFLSNNLYKTETVTEEEIIPK
jgi:hypothetical protein